MIRGDLYRSSRPSWLSALVIISILDVARIDNYVGISEAWRLIWNHTLGLTTAHRDASRLTADKLHVRSLTYPVLSCLDGSLLLLLFHFVDVDFVEHVDCRCNPVDLRAALTLLLADVSA